MRLPRVRFTVRTMMVIAEVVALAQGTAVGGGGSGHVRLDRAIAEADRLDPGWKLKDIEATRVRPAGGKDSAQVLGSAEGQLSSATITEIEVLNTASGADSGRRLDPAAKKELAAFVGRNHAVLTALRGLDGRPSGRFGYQARKNYLDIPLPHLRTLRDQVRLLLADALLSLDGGDADAALGRCRAAVCAARSLLDEPFAISQLVRVACDANTQQVVLLALARGRPSAAALTMTQHLLADEVDQPMALIALRGERAIMFETLGHLADGSLRLDEMTATANLSKRFPDAFQDHLVRSGLFQASRGIMLEQMTRMVEVVRKPSWTWCEGIERFERTIKEVDPKRSPEEIIPGLLIPATSPLIRGELRTDALGRAVILLIAAKRYALTRGQWPESAEALVPGYLMAVPTDPLTGGPMRLVKKEDRLSAYSLGVDGRDDGGEVAGSSRQDVKKSADVGFELSTRRAR